MGVFFAGIEFLAPVDIFRAGVAAHAERGHEAHCLLTVVAFPTSAIKFAGVEVWGIVLTQDLSLGHGVVVMVEISTMCDNTHYTQ